MVVLGVVAACAVGWVVAPVVALRRRGSLDEQRLAAMREETRRLTATPPPGSVTPLPAPRPAVDDAAGPAAPSTSGTRATPA